MRGADGFLVECGVGEQGELLGRITKGSPMSFDGYADPKDNERKLLRDCFEKGDLYLRTGDLLKRDHASYYYFVDRIGDTFRWKGENVATLEVEHLLNAAPGVHETAVYGVTVPGTEGRAGMALVVPADGAPFDPEGFYAFAARVLPPYARPLFVRVATQVDVTGNFKNRKTRLQAEAFDPARIARRAVVPRRRAPGVRSARRAAARRDRRRASEALMLTVLVNLQGAVRKAPMLDPAWLEPESTASVWVDLAAPTIEEASILKTIFHFHDLAVEDALSESHHPKVESYGTFLYVILHGIDFESAKHSFATHDTDFFVGRELPGHGARRHLALDRAAAGHLPAQRARARRAAPSRCCTASSTPWSTTTCPRSRSCRSGSSRSSTACSRSPTTTW